MPGLTINRNSAGQSFIAPSVQSEEEMLHFSIKKGALKKIVKGAENDVSKAAKAVASVAKTVVNAAIKVLKTVGEDVIFAPLLPFKGAMKSEIQKAGLTTDNTMGDVIMKFFRAISSKGNSFEALHIDLDDAVNTAQNIQDAADSAVASGNADANPAVDSSDSNYQKLLNEPPPPLNSVTPTRVIPAPPVPQIVVSAVTAAGNLVGVPAPVSLIAAQTIWGFLHKAKQIPGSGCNKCLNDIHAACKNDSKKKDDEVEGEIEIGNFKIKTAIFAPAALFVLIGIIVLVVVIKHHSKKS